MRVIEDSTLTCRKATQYMIPPHPGRLNPVKLQYVTSLHMTTKEVGGKERRLCLSFEIPP